MTQPQNASGWQPGALAGPSRQWMCGNRFGDHHVGCPAGGPCEYELGYCLKYGHAIPAPVDLVAWAISPAECGGLPECWVERLPFVNTRGNSVMLGPHDALRNTILVWRHDPHPCVPAGRLVCS